MSARRYGVRLVTELAVASLAVLQQRKSHREPPSPARLHLLCDASAVLLGGGEPTRGGMVFGDWAAAAPGTVGGRIISAACARS